MSGENAVTAESVARLRVRAAEITDQVRRMTGSLTETAAKAAAIEVSARSGDGLVVATVGADGRLRRLDLDPRIYHYPDAAELSRTIEETITAAATEAQRRTLELYAPVVPAATLAALADRDPQKMMTTLAGDFTGSERIDDGR